MQKCTIARPKVVVGKYSICPTNSHVKNEKLFVARGLDTFVVQLVNGGKVERKKKTSNLWQFGIF
jgi:D-lyxose ketol-isomerase